MTNTTTTQFITLYNTKHTKLVNQLMKHFSELSDDEAQDIVHSSWEVLWGMVYKSDEQTDMSFLNATYIWQTCRNLAHLYLRKRARFMTESMSVYYHKQDDSTDTPSREYDYAFWEQQDREEQAQDLILTRTQDVHNELQKMSESHRQLIIGHYIDHKPYSELAPQLGFKSADVAKQVANREIKRLRSVLRHAA